MDLTTASLAAPPPRRRVRLYSLAAVIVQGLLGLTWGWLSIGMLSSGIGALPVLGSGLLLLVPWALAMQLAVAYERHRAAWLHGLDVIVPARHRSLRTGLSGTAHNLWLDLSSWAFWRGVLHHHLSMLAASFCLLVVGAMLWIASTAVQIVLLHGAVELGRTTVPAGTLVLIVVAALALTALALLLGALADRGLARVMISGSEEDLREQVVELAHRRQGAVDAAAQERARIERDLHDGVQPRLVAMAMTLGMAKSAIRTDPDRATELVAQAHSEAKGIMTDLRQLARGIRPAVLEDRGLDAALSALAARSVVPVQLDLDLPTELGKEREAVAYFVVAEALTNIAKHAEASSARVDLSESDGSLVVRIEDDGHGGAQVRRDGVSTGLAGLTDRVRATGGRLEITSSPDTGGTVLQAVIPFDSSPGAMPAPSLQAAPMAAASTTPAQEDLR